MQLYLQDVIDKMKYGKAVSKAKLHINFEGKDKIELSERSEADFEIK